MSTISPSQPGQQEPATASPTAPQIPLPESSAATYTIAPTLLCSPYVLSPEAYLAANPPITNLLASAAVFHLNRLLLVQRAPTDFFPLKWELPGGSVDFDDGSVIAAAVRELREETGLRAAGVVRWIGDREFAEVDGRRWWRQGIFEVTVALDAGEEKSVPKVKLDPKEHVDYRWVTVEDVREGRCGDVVLEYADPEWKALLLKALELHGV